MSASLNHYKKMRAEPCRRFLKQPAAKLEPVIVALIVSKQLCITVLEGTACNGYSLSF